MKWFMRLRRFSHSCNERGFTLVEMLVASSIGLIMLGIVLSSTLGNRELYSNDLVRTRLNQNLRSALDIVGITAREAGENLVGSFPTLLFTDGASGAPDSLTLRRNLYSEVLNVCTALTAGTSTATIIFGSSASAVAGCDITSNVNSFNVWSAYRVAQGGQVQAYIYNIGTKQGEWFTYGGEANTGAQLSITKAGGGNWTYSYPVGTSVVYLLEEWKFQVNNDYLELIQDNDTSNPLNVAFGITDFQISAAMNDGTTKTAFTSSDNWTNLRTLRITLEGEDTTSKGKTFTSSLSSDYFLRNILSN